MALPNKEKPTKSLGNALCVMPSNGSPQTLRFVVVSCTANIDSRKGMLMSRLLSPRGAGMLFLYQSPIPSAGSFTPFYPHHSSLPL